MPKKSAAISSIEKSPEQRRDHTDAYCQHAEQHQPRPNQFAPSNMLILTVIFPDFEIVRVSIAEYPLDAAVASAGVVSFHHLPRKGQNNARKNGDASTTATAITMAEVVRRMNVRVHTAASFSG